MALVSWGLFLAGAFVAEVIGTMAGFGAATVLTPIAAAFLDIKTAIAVVACFHLFGTGSRLVFFGRFVHWKTWACFGLTGVVCSLLGAQVTARLPSPMVRLLFGAFLLVYVGCEASAAGRFRLPARTSTLVGGGAVSGLIAGLLGTGGAIRSACLLVFGLPKDVYIGTSAAIAIMVDATRVPVYLAQRLIPGALLPVIASLIPAAFAGAWLGQRLVRRVSPAVFRWIVMGMLTLTGLKMAWDGWHGV